MYIDHCGSAAMYTEYANDFIKKKERSKDYLDGALIITVNLSSLIYID